MKDHTLEIVLERLSESGHELLFHSAIEGLCPESRGEVLTYLLGASPEDVSTLLETYNHLPPALKERHTKALVAQRIPKDDLTGLYNKKQFESDLIRAIDDVERFLAARSALDESLPDNLRSDRRRGVGRRHGEDEPEQRRRIPPLYDDVSVLFIDVDRFKSINDKYGHRFGDKILRDVAECMASSVRDEDKSRLYRYAGDEFCGMIYHTSPDQGIIVAERMRKSVEERLRDAIPNRLVTISVGVANYRKTCTARDTEMLIQQADAALYAAKRNGRDRIEVFTPEMMRGKYAAQLNRKYGT